MAPKKCAFRNCPNTSDQNPNKRFFYFRKHDYPLWIDACQNAVLKAYSVNTLTRHTTVCSEHFSSEDFTRIFSPFKTRLTFSAVPHGPGKRLVLMGSFILINLI